MAINSAVLHETVFLEYLLTANDVFTGKQDASIGSQHLTRDWWVVGTDAQGKVAKHGKAEKKGDYGCLKP